MPKDLTLISAILPAIIKPEHKALSKIQERLLSLPLPADDEEAAILYQHSVLCQTCMPYRDPGDETRAWQRSNGLASLLIQEPSPRGTYALSRSCRRDRSNSMTIRLKIHCAGSLPNVK